MKPLSTFAFAILLLGSVADRARAESRLLVLSTAAPVAVPELDESLRSWARSDSRFRVSDRTLRQESALRDSHCDRLDDTCLARIASRYGADRILYGAVAPLPEDADEVQVSLHVFDKYTGRTRDSMAGSIEADDLGNPRKLQELMATIVPAVLAVPEEGAARVHARAGSIVHLDGAQFGVVPESGELEVSPIPVGRRVVRVERAGAPEWEAPIVVRTRETIRVTVGTGSVAFAAELQHAAGPTTESASSTSDWTLPAVEDTSPTEATDPFSVGVGVARVRFSIPLIDEHIQRGEIRAAMNARVGFLPNVSATGARVTAKLRF